MKWISMEENPPTYVQEILFIADESITDERIGIACADIETVLLKRTDISFNKIKWWFPIPPDPEE